MQDTRTPPVLDAIYEQITRGAAGCSDLVWCSDLSDEHAANNGQILMDYSLGYSHLAAQLSAHELDLQNAPMGKENQKLDVSVSPRIHTESVNSRNLHRQLELLRVSEQKTYADLLASEQECERLIALVSTLEDSRRDMQGWKEIAAVAKMLYVEGEEIASNLRADLAAATDRVRNVQEQLDRQIEVATSKDSVIQSITKQSRLAQIRLKISRDMIKRSDRETNELLHQKAMIEGRHELEIRRLTQEAQGAQEQLDALRHALSQLPPDRRPPLDRDRDHPVRYQPPTTWSYDTDRPPLPPEWNLNTGASPVSSAIDPDSAHRSIKWSPRSPIQDSSARLLEIPGFCDQESQVAKEQRAAPADLIERMRQVEPESAQDVKPNERDLQEELIATKEQLRLAEEEVLHLRRELGQSRVSLRDLETHVRALENELGICQATMREAQDAQYASEIKFTEATQLLREHQAESESSMARAEESQFKCSQVTFLCATLRERVTELEAKVNKLKSARKYRAHSNSRSRRPTGTCTGMLAPDLRCLVYLYVRALSDLEAVAHDPEFREFDSINMIVPPSMPRLLDLSLPPSSSPSNDSSLYLNQPECSTIPLVSADTGLCCPTETGMFATPFFPGVACLSTVPYRIRTPSDPEANTGYTDAHTFDSIFMTTPPSLPRLPDISALSSSSQSSTSSLCSSHQMRPTKPPTCADSHTFSPGHTGTRTLNFQLPWSCKLMISILSDLDVTTPDVNSQILDSSMPPQESASECLYGSQRMDR